MLPSKLLDAYFNQLVYAIGNYHYNWHPAIEVLMVIEGEVIANVEGYQYRLQPADLIVVNANQGHATLAAQQNTLAIRTYIAPQFFQEQGVKLDTGRFALNSALIRQHPQYAVLRQAIAQLYLADKELVRNSAGFRLADLLYEYFFVPAERGQAPHQQNIHLRQVAKDIQQHYQSPLTLEKLAAKYGYSQPYFSRIFKQHFGIGFYEYLTRERLQHALSDLNRHQEKISTVALDNGFTEVKSFNLAFKKHFGITPSAYQAKSRPQSTTVDAHFQQALSPQQQALAHDYLVGLLHPQQKEKSALECQECVYRQNSRRYQQLRQQLKLLLNDKN